MRLIPSLDGSLYKFNGETVEPLPLTADFLLKSSFKLGDDLVITGGKEARSYGINLHTGQAGLFLSCLQDTPTSMQCWSHNYIIDDSTIEPL